MGPRTTRALALTAAAVALAGIAQVARADAAPSLLVSNHVLRRGDSTQIWGSGFSPGTSYTVAADYGTLNNAGASLPVTASASGHFTATFTMTFDVPADVSTVTIAVTDQQQTTVLTESIAVAEPYLVGGACPGRPIGQIATEDIDGNYLTGVGGLGFPDGSYTLTSDSVTFTHPTVQASQGAVYVGGQAVPNLAATFSVSAALQTSPFTSWTWTWQRGKGHAFVNGEQTPWTPRIKGNCFAPGETVRLRSHDAQTTVPRSVTADSSGRFTAIATLHPSTQPATSEPLSTAGVASGQTAHTTPQRIDGTTLFAGQALVSRQRLLSSRYGYMFRQGYECQPSIWAFSPGGTMGEIWQVPTRSRVNAGCRLVMRSGGNLVLITSSGRLLWSTHTAGTGRGNYLRMRSDGIAAVYTASGKVIWTSRAGRRT